MDNSVIEKAIEAGTCRVESVVENIEKKVLKLLADSDWDRTKLQAYLRGMGDKLKDESSSAHGILEHFSPKEAQSEVEVLANRGLINIIKVDDKSIVYLTTQGEEALNVMGVSPSPITTIDALKKKIHGPQAKLILKAALDEWYETQRLAVSSPRGWWDSFEFFRKEKFNIFGQDITGQQLVETYFARRYSRQRGKNPIKTHCRDFLNHVFDNRIKTEI